MGRRIDFEVVDRWKEFEVQIDHRRASLEPRLNPLVKSRSGVQTELFHAVANVPRRVTRQAKKCRVADSHHSASAI